MLHRHRRWLALLLIAISPALGGTLLPSLHPCPVDAPWSMPAMMSGHSHAAMMDAAMTDGDPHGESQQAPASTQHECSCIGCCAAPQLSTPPTAPIVAIGLVETPQRAGWTVTDLIGLVHPVHEFLPESTAPPLA